jgi:hypothetical protein
MKESLKENSLYWWIMLVVMKYKIINIIIGKPTCEIIKVIGNSCG